MSFQSSVRQLMTYGIVGEVIFDGPQRAEPVILDSADAANNVIGRAFTSPAGEDSTVDAGGTGVFRGILVNPLVYATSGTTAGALEPTLTLPNNTNVEVLSMGTIIVSLLNAASIGDSVMFTQSTGELSALPPVATFTASQATTVLTVSAITAGKIGVGSVIKNASGEILGEVISLGTGTGGTGTYNMSTSATVGSAAMSANSVAPSGKTVIPNARVVRENTSGAGLAIVTLTN